MPYLTDMPDSFKDYGMCKVLLVRNEIINLKHLFTEIFVRKTINIQEKLNFLGLNLVTYIEYLTNRMRRIHKINREYTNDLNEIVKNDRSSIFETIKLYSGLKTAVVLDFDGVLTKKRFWELYNLFIRRSVVIVNSANSTLTEKWFIKNNLPIPYKIYANKGKEKKIRNLIELNKRYDFLFYVDNETEYLDYAWIFNIKTFLYKNNKIVKYSLNSK